MPGVVQASVSHLIGLLRGRWLSEFRLGAQAVFRSEPAWMDRPCERDRGQAGL